MDASLLTEYKKIFSPYNSIPAVYDPEQERWSILKNLRYINTGLIEQHLNGNIILGRFIKHGNIQFFCLDFDYSKDTYKDLDEFYSFVKPVIQLVQAPKLIVRSSNSEGIHTYYFLKRNFTRVVKDRITAYLLQHGIQIQSGKVELYTGNQTLRFPFGIGSYELDEELKPTGCDKIESLHKFFNNFDKNSLPTLSDATPNFKPKKIYYTRDYKQTDSNLEDLLKNGISRRRSFHASCITIAKYFYQMYKTPEQVKEKVLEWFDNNHNSLSSTYFDKIKLNKEVDSIINWLVKKETLPMDFKFNDIPEWACKFIYDNFDTYSKQKAVFNVFQIIKKQLSLYRNELKLDDNKNLSKVKIPISKSYITNSVYGIGMNSKNYKYIINRLIESDILAIDNAGNSKKAHCTYYNWVGPSLFEGIDYYKDFSLFLDSERNKKYKTCYSKYIRDKICKDSAEIREFFRKNAI